MNYAVSVPYIYVQNADVVANLKAFRRKWSFVAEEAILGFGLKTKRTVGGPVGPPPVPLQ